MDLFTPVVSEDRLHQHFRTVMDPMHASSRNVVKSWSEEFPDRDGKFVQEFQLSFNSSFWELYLHAVIKEYGYTCDWTSPSPDFSLRTPKQRLLIEAVTANAANGKPNEWDKNYKQENFQRIDIQALNHEAMIRLANAILAKHRKYKEKYSKLTHVKGNPFVLAVAPFEQPFFNHQYNRPIKAVLYDHYVDEEEYLKDPTKFPQGPRSKQLGFVRKENGADIELGLFNDDRMQEISAVVFSCTATWGKVDALASEDTPRKTIISTMWGSEPYGQPVRRVGTPSEIGEKITDGLQIYHNPFALHPLDPLVFRRQGVVQVYLDRETNQWVEEELTRSLFFRIAYSVSPREKESDEADEEVS